VFRCRVSATASMELPRAASGLSGITPNPLPAVSTVMSDTQTQQVPSNSISSSRRRRGSQSGAQSRHGQHGASQRDRQHRRHSRRRQGQQSLMSWMWLKLCCHIRKSTIDFFEAVDAGRVDAVREMVKLSPAMLLRTRPGTRWTAVLDQRRAGAPAHISCTGIGGRPNDYTKRMVNALTEKNLTPLMLACKRGCVACMFACIACCHTRGAERHFARS
jgi:hypothetical protein